MQSGAIRPVPNMLPRKLFTSDHEAFRETVRKFYEKEVVPNIENMRNNNMLTVTYGIRPENWAYCVPPCRSNMVVQVSTGSTA